MNNAIMLVRNRPLLTKQAITTFLAHSKYDWTLTVIDDASDFQTQTLLDGLASQPRIRVLRHMRVTSNTALSRNLGVHFSQRFFGRGDYLYLSDNDAFFLPSWDHYLIHAYQDVQDTYRLLGPYRHPYHHPHKEGTEVVELGGRMMKVVSTDAVQGIGHLMTWETWDRWGPLVEHPGVGLGTNQSEDFDFCQRIVKDGFRVGSLEPFVVLNCGITGTDGKPSPGADLIERVEGVFYA